MKSYAFPWGKKDPIHKQRGEKKEKEKDLIEFYVIITDFFFLQYHIKLIEYRTIHTNNH